MRLRLLSSVSVLVGLSLSPLAAHAGFEFVSPSQQQAAPKVTAETAPTPLAPVANDKVADEVLSLPAAKAPVAAEPSFGAKAIPLTPVVKQSDALLVSDAPLIPMDAHREVANNMMKAPPSTIKPDTLWDKPVAPAANVSPVADMMPLAAPAGMTPSNPADKTVQGFGRNVPLVMALQQIVPSNYRYSFGPGIAPGQRIDWQGNDRPWKDVLSDVARRNDLNVDIVSNVVALRQRGPMDIVAPHKADMVADNTVMGMELKPPAPLPVIPSEDLPPLPAPGPVVADKAPMALAPPVLMTPDTMTPPKTADADMPMPLLPSMNDDKPAASSAPVVLAQKSEKTDEKLVVKTPEKTEEKKSFFDSMFDSKEKEKVTADSKIAAPAPVQNKQILTVDSDAAVAKQDMDRPDVTWDASPAMAPEKIAEKSIKPTGGVDLPTAPAGKDGKSDAPLPLAEPDQKDMPPLAKTENPVLPAPKSDGAEKAPITSADLQSALEWEAHKGETLRQSLTAWSERAGVSVVWSSEYDYPLQTDVRIQSTYPDAVRTLLAGFSKAQPRPLGRLFKNQSTGAQPVLVVETNRLTR